MRPSKLALLALGVCASACEPHEDPLAQPSLEQSQDGLGGNGQIGFNPVYAPLPPATVKEPKQVHLGPVRDWTIRRVRELEALVRAKPAMVEELFVPVKTMRDVSVPRTLEGTGLAVAFLRDVAAGIHDAVKLPACLSRTSPPGGQPMWSPTEGALGVTIDQCRMGARGHVKISGFAVVTWRDDVLSAEMADAEVVVEEDTLRVSARVEWPSWSTDPSPMIRVDADSMPSVGPDSASGSARQISIDSAEVELPDLDGNYGIRVVVPEGHAHVRWGVEPMRAIDFGADFHFTYGPDSAAWETFSVVARSRNRLSNVSAAEVSRLEMSFVPGGFTGTAQFSAVAGTSSIRSEGDGVALVSRGDELYASGRMTLMVARLGAMAEMVARDVRFDLADISLPSEGGMDLRWNDQGTENTLVLQFQSNSPTARWVRAFHREFYELIDSTSGDVRPMSYWGWFCAQLEAKPIVQRLDERMAQTVYCQ